jgi:hypothetical protein
VTTADIHTIEDNRIYILIRFMTGLLIEEYFGGDRFTDRNFSFSTMGMIISPASRQINGEYQRMVAIRY